jgi:hypothetical protein
MSSRSPLLRPRGPERAGDNDDLDDGEEWDPDENEDDEAGDDEDDEDDDTETWQVGSPAALAR